MARKSKVSVEISAVNKTRQAFKQVENDLTRIGKTASKVSGIFGAISGAALVGAGAGIAKISAEFETLRKTLETVTGSTVSAERAFQQIQEFASTTPFQVEQITEAFIKLKALGLDPSQEALRSYGNTAAAFGKSLNQVVEAVADATTGEFERLKEFGIKARSEGDRVTFTFRGIETTVRKNAADIERYIRDIGDLTFADAMENQADTLAVAFSNLTDSFRLAAEELGRSSGFNDLLKSTITTLKDFIRETFTAEGRVDALRTAFERYQQGTLSGRNAPGARRGQQLTAELLQALEEAGGVVGIRTEIARLEEELRGLEDQAVGASARRRGGSRQSQRGNLERRLEELQNLLAEVELDMSDVGDAGVQSGEKAAGGFEKTRQSVKALKDDMDLLLDIYEAEEEANDKRFAQAQAGDTQEFRQALQDREDSLQRQKDLEEEANRAREAALSRQKDFADSVAATMTSAFEQAILQANSLSDIFNALLQDIATLVIRMAVLQPLAQSISGGITPFLGGFATGGVTPRSGIAMVGEAGPEMVALPGGSQVIPNKALGSNVNIQVVNNAGADVQTQTETAPDGSSLVRFIINTVANDMTNNGATARALGTFGANMQPVVR